MANPILTGWSLLTRNFMLFHRRCNAGARVELAARAFATACVAALAFTAHARAQGTASAYPERNVRIIIPFAAGGATDAVARPWAERFKTALNATLVLENMGGAGGSIGAAHAARAPADGYTLLIGSISTQIITPAIANPSPYDALKDFDSIAMLVSSTLAFAVHPAVPVKTLAELTAYSKANPGKISYGTPGAGSLNHLVGELYHALAGAGDIAHVPYRGGGPALADLLGGQLPMIVPVMTGQIIQMHRTGKLRVLAVARHDRLGNLPDVPTGEEAGIKGLIADGFYGLFAPAGTPRVIINKLAVAARVAISDPALQKQLNDAGFEPVLDPSPEKARSAIGENIARWAPVIVRTGLKRNK